MAWLQTYLADFKGTVLAITHDRYFLEDTCKWILELERGEGKPYEGNYSGWLAKKAQLLAQQKRRIRAAPPTDAERPPPSHACCTDPSRGHT